MMWIYGEEKTTKISRTVLRCAANAIVVVLGLSSAAVAQINQPQHCIVDISFSGEHLNRSYLRLPDVEGQPFPLFNEETVSQNENRSRARTQFWRVENNAPTLTAMSPLNVSANFREAVADESGNLYFIAGQYKPVGVGNDEAWTAELFVSEAGEPPRQLTQFNSNTIVAHEVYRDSFSNRTRLEISESDRPLVSYALGKPPRFADVGPTGIGPVMAEKASFRLGIPAGPYGGSLHLFRQALFYVSKSGVEHEVTELLSSLDYGGWRRIVKADSGNGFWALADDVGSYFELDWSAEPPQVLSKSLHRESQGMAEILKVLIGSDTHLLQRYHYGSVHTGYTYKSFNCGIYGTVPLGKVTCHGQTYTNNAFVWPEGTPWWGSLEFAGSFASPPTDVFFSSTGGVYVFRDGRFQPLKGVRAERPVFVLDNAEHGQFLSTGSGVYQIVQAGSSITAKEIVGLSSRTDFARVLHLGGKNWLFHRDGVASISGVVAHPFYFKENENIDVTGLITPTLIPRWSGIVFQTRSKAGIVSLKLLTDRGDFCRPKPPANSSEP